MLGLDGLQSAGAGPRLGVPRFRDVRALPAAPQTPFPGLRRPASWELYLPLGDAGPHPGSGPTSAPPRQVPSTVGRRACDRASSVPPRTPGQVVHTLSPSGDPSEAGSGTLGSAYRSPSAVSLHLSMGADPLTSACQPTLKEGRDLGGAPAGDQR